MCNCAEWESLVRSFDHAVEHGEVRDCVSDAAARIEALIDSVMRSACAPEDTEWVRTHASRSRRESIVL